MPLVTVPPSRLALCLDVDQTLIVNVTNPLPRPGLSAFLHEAIRRCPFVCLYSAAHCDAIDEAFAFLVTSGVLPSLFFSLPRIVWNRRGHKDLYRVWMQYPETRNLWPVLVDDLSPFVVPTQKGQHIPIAPYVQENPQDTELFRLLEGPLTHGVLAPVGP